MNSFISKVLDKLQIDEKQYQELIKETSYSNIENPSNFTNIDIAIERIQKAMDNNEKIMIYGDYDCDGISATTILNYTFKKLGYNVGFYIPSRYKDGYGINEKMVELIASKGYKLIITVDNGISQIDALKLAKEKGIDVILTDHHEIPDVIPECYTIVHPFYKNSDDKLPQCGAYVAFMMSIKLLNGIDDYLLTLGALATISDMMPLKGYNRDIVKMAIKTLDEKKYKNLMSLCDNTNIINEKTFSFTIAPKINSLGRVLKDNKVNRGVSYLSTDNDEEIYMLCSFINDTVKVRKTMTDDAFKSLDLSKYEKDNVIVAVFENLSEGIIGLVAQKIMNESKKPCVCLTFDENGYLLKGSARSLIGFNIAESLNKLDYLLEAHGGHAQAGGLSLKKENLAEFTKLINEMAKGAILKEKEKIIIEVDKNELTMDNFNEFRKLAPFGEQFEEPYFQVHIKKEEIQTISNGKHIKGKLSNECNYVGWNYGTYCFNNDVILIGKLVLNEYRGIVSLNLNVEEIK